MKLKPVKSKDSNGPRYVLAVDIDGTLIYADGSPRPDLLSLVQHVRPPWRLILVSARPACGVKLVQDQFGLSCPFVCLNGAAVCDSSFSQPILSCPIPIDVQSELLVGLSGVPLKALFRYTHRAWYTTGCKDSVQAEKQLTGGKPRLTPELAKNSGIGTLKYTAVLSPSDVLPALKTLERRVGGHVHMVRSSLSYLEITAKGTNKASGLQKYLARSRGKPYIVAIGDGDNDVALFQLANVAFAVESASVALKSVATGILPYPCTRILSDLQSRHEFVKK